ncbi:hypothetical protein [Citricoccus sp. CH26A]|uniref:hypothetical protein n=1 Tax=Citricoccus sp. CH26A TaxID=1045009 RepID=UPI001300C8B8|nr:hypothetical protein [Citricoccus sp. CH26A]
MAGQVVGQPGADVLAGLALGQAQQPHGGVGHGTFGGVGPAEGGLDQSGRVLEAVEGLEPQLEDHGVADPVGDLARSGPGRVVRRGQVVRVPGHTVTGARRAVGEDRVHPVCPGPARVQPHEHPVTVHGTAEDPVPVGFRRGDGQDAGTDGVACRRAPPGQGDVLAGGEVGVADQSSLLVQDAEVAVCGVEPPG